MRVLLLLLVFVLSACGPLDNPTGIPASATAHWSLKGGFHWTWVQTLEGGCTDWMAKDSWAVVTINIDAKCDGKADETVARGVSYSSNDDYIIFKGYWPWSQDDYFKLIEFNDAGMISSVRRCPYSLSAQQIDEIGVVVRQAIADAQTDGERRVLAQVGRRLGALDGTNLASSQFGCTDYNASLVEVDVWAHQ